MPASKLVGRFLCDLLGSAIPLFMPTVVIAGPDAAGSDKYLAELACAVPGGAASAPRFVPELGIVRKQWRLAFRDFNLLKTHTHTSEGKRIETGGCQIGKSTDDL